MDVILKNDSMALAAQETSLTVSKAFDGENMRSMMAKGEAGTGVKALALLLIRTAKKMAITNMTNDFSGLAEELFFDNPTLTIEDFTLLFKNGRRGDYGKDFNRLDIAVIQGWVLAYEEEKAKEREKRIYNQNLEDKKEWDSPEFSTKYHEVRKKLGYSDKPEPTMSEEELAALESADAFYEYLKKHIHEFNPSKLGSLFHKEKNSSATGGDPRVIELISKKATSQGYDIETFEAVTNPVKVQKALKELDQLLVDSTQSSESMIKLMQTRLKDMDTEEYLQAKDRTEQAFKANPKKYELYMKAVQLEEKRRNGSPSI